MKVVVIDYYDIIGNKKDGWDVNGQSVNTYKTRFELDSKESCLKFLKSTFYIRKTARVKTFIWKNIENGFLLFEKDKMPVLSVIKINEGEGK